MNLGKSCALGKKGESDVKNRNREQELYLSDHRRILKADKGGTEIGYSISSCFTGIKECHGRHI